MMIILPDSGREVELQRPDHSSSVVYMMATKKYPRPSPPMQEVKLMGKMEWVENLAHPVFDREITAWNRKIQTIVTEKLILYSVANEPTDDDLVQVNITRGKMGDLVENLTDIEVFIFFVLIKSQEDFEALSEAIGELTSPTEAQIANHKQRFQRATQGQGYLQMQNSQG